MSRDKFEAMVDRFAECEGYCNGSDILYREDVVKLLRREHAALARAVKRLFPVHCCEQCDGKHEITVMLKDVIALLAVRKGRRG